MFKSARLKLTLFYLATFLVISLVLTVGIRILAERAFDSSNNSQAGSFQTLLRREEGLPFPSHPFTRLQTQQEDLVHHKLTDYVIEINLVALVIGGIASYWFAGRTLRPIQEAHLAQARFASDASHELRTPLAVMKTENEVFLRQRNFSETDARNQIKSNLEEIQRLEQLATNLLSIANYEQGERLELKDIQTEDVAKSSIARLKKLYPKEFKRIKVNVEKGMVYGHLDSLAQILSIFLENALKYSPSNEDINLIGHVYDGVYKFTVEDKGPGIDPNDMPLIFDRLFRSDKNRSKAVPGHGLGLSLAKEIGKANEAGLSVANRPEGGAAFSLIVRLG